MHIPQFILHKVHQVTAWCSQKATQWRGWWVTNVTPNWNGLCERVHRVFFSHSTNQSSPVAPPSSPPVVSFWTSLGLTVNGPMSAAGKRLPTKGFRNNDQQTCEYISKSVAILALAPDLEIPEKEQDAWYQKEKHELQQLFVKARELQEQSEKAVAEEGKLKQAVVHAAKDLWDDLGNSSDPVPSHKQLLRSASDRILEIRSYLPAASWGVDRDEEDETTDSDPSLLEIETRKKNLWALQGRFDELKTAIQSTEEIQKKIHLLKRDTLENTQEIASSQERLQKRESSLQNAKEALRIWREGNQTGLLEKRHAIAITECHPARDMFEKRNTLFKGAEEAGQAEKEGDHIKALKTRLENPKESAAILYGGGEHWRVFIRLQDGRFALFNDDRELQFWSQTEILDNWSTPANWIKSQLTFIPAWPSLSSPSAVGVAEQSL